MRPAAPLRRILLLLAAALYLPAADLQAQVSDTTSAPVPRPTVPGAADTIPGPPRLAGDTVPVAGDSLPGDTLTAAERAAPPDPEAEAIIAELRNLPGYVPTEYLGQRAVYRTEEGVLRLIGQAQVEREGSRLNADSIIYRDAADRVEAYGNPSVTGESQELTGDVLYYDLATRRASAINARTEVTESATWIVRGDVTVEPGDATRIFATAGHFTTCDLDIPHYHFEADRIKIVKDRYLVGRPARLYFGKVPVMVLPFFVQSLQQGRRSGLLVPRFGLTDVVRNSGHTREITNLGWYWAVNDYIGAELTGTWRSGAYTGLRGNMDFRWRRQFLDGNVGLERIWETSGSRQFALDSRASWRPDERTSLSGSGRYVTSSTFIRQSTIDPLEASQDLNSSFSLSRRFDWGALAFGATGQQSIADGGISYTLPSLSLSPNPITLFRSSSPDPAWYENATVQWGFRTTRSGTADKSDFRDRIQDQLRNDVSGNLSFTVGNLSLSTSGQLNAAKFEEVVGFDSLGVEIGRLAGGHRDRGSWNASIGYQQDLIGQTTFTPSLGFSQEIRRDSLTRNEYFAAPTRMNFGASLSTAIFGQFGGIGPFSRIRHRVTPTLSFTVSPAVQQNARQDSVFGGIESLTQNVLEFGFNQNFEAKLRRPQRSAADDSAAAVLDTTTVGDTLAARQAQQPVPQEEEKVTLLSINTSTFRYDFTRAQETGNGFVTTSVTNTLTSDYLRGLTIQIAHDLFDQSGINPDSALQRGQLGRFAPRLSRLSTGFELGPNSAIFRWLGFRMGARSAAQEGRVPGTEGRQPGDPAGTSTSTGNPQGLGGGAWRTSIDYSYTRPSRTWDPNGLRDDRAIQTMNLTTNFALTENWGVDWRTSYSLTDNEFSGHALNFSRNLHRWQANFSFYQTPSGNTSFQFFVELIDNRDLKFDYRETNLGIDR